MSKIPTTISLLLALALVSQGCGTETTKATTDTSTADTATDATESDASGDATGGDDATTADGTTADGTTTDAAEDTASSKTYKTCSALGDCVIAACAPKAFEAGCQDACLGDAEDAALLPAAGLLSCVQKVCLPACKDSKEASCLDDCMGENCSADMVACVTQGVTPAGTTSCMEVGQCFDGCGIGKSAKPFSCFSECITKTDNAGLKGMLAIAKCQAEAKKDGKDPEEVCGGAYMECLVSGKSGDKSCFDVFGCQEECGKTGKGDDECLAVCLPQLSKEAQATFIEAIPCFESKDPACAPKLLKCVDPQGEKTCFESLACIDACKAGEGDSGGCIFGCFHDTKASAAPVLLSTISICDDGKDAAPLPGDATPAGSDAPSKECMASLVTCIDPPETGLSCTQLVQCFGDCDKADPKVESCPFTCISKGAKADVKLVVDFMSCNSECETDCKDSSDESCKVKCLSTKCPEPLSKCVPS